jgi:hypothetical protein
VSETNATPPHGRKLENICEISLPRWAILILTASVKSGKFDGDVTPAVECLPRSSEFKPRYHQTNNNKKSGKFKYNVFLSATLKNHPFKVPFAYPHHS